MRHLVDDGDGEQRLAEFEAEKARLDAEVEETRARLAENERSIERVESVLADLEAVPEVTPTDGDTETPASGDEETPTSGDEETPESGGEETPESEENCRCEEAWLSIEAQTETGFGHAWVTLEARYEPPSCDDESDSWGLYPEGGVKAEGVVANQSGAIRSDDSNHLTLGEDFSGCSARAEIDCDTYVSLRRGVAKQVEDPPDYNAPAVVGHNCVTWAQDVWRDAGLRMDRWGMRTPRELCSSMRDWDELFGYEVTIHE